MRFFAEGWDYELWETDGLLLRFPKREECAAPLLVEARLLHELAAALSVPVPRPELISDGCDAFPLPFFVYRKLPGVPLSEAALNGEAAASVAAQLGRFLSELHRFPIERAQAAGVPVYSTDAWREHYRGFSTQIRKQVLPLLPPGEAAAVDAFWRDFLTDDRLFPFQPTLIHGDLDDAHVLVNTQAARITGVIDLGDACVGDPALDFAGWDGLLRAAVIAAYDLQVDETLLERAEMYRRRISPFHAVLHGLEIGDAACVRRGIDAIRKEAMQAS